MAFEGLAEKLQAAFQKLNNRGKLTEKDVKDAMREVRMALLEADVNYLVVKDFVKRVTDRAVGEEIFTTLNAGQTVIKIVREELTALFVSEIRDGMLQPDGTRSAAKAGMVKLAYEKEGWRSEEYKTLFEAVADAAAQTGAPVMVHTEKQNDLLGLLAFLAQHHVPAERVLICHLDRTNTDPEYHKTLLRTGCYFCYDSVHRYKYVSDEQELALLKEVCEAGYAGQIVLSLDTTNQRLRAYNAPDMGLDYILTDFIPMLRAAGFTESQISAMCESNAVEILQLQDTEVTR